MIMEKAHFFDTQVAESWASGEYTSLETERLQKALCDAGISAGMKILEPGCGTGRLTHLMSHQVGPYGNILGLDMSPRMMETSRDRLKSVGNVRLSLGTMEGIDLVPHSFDAVIFHNVFHHFDDKLAVIEKTAKTIKPHGQFMIHHFLDFSQINNPDRKTHEIVAQDFMPSQEELLSMLTASGLKMTYYSDSDDGFIVRAVSG